MKQEVTCKTCETGRQNLKSNPDYCPYINQIVSSKDDPSFDCQMYKGIVDNVNHPSHYTTGKIEVIDYIEDKLTPEEFRGYIKGNVIKYLAREKHKNGDEDLCKAKWYLDRFISSTKGEGDERGQELKEVNNDE